jgi:hypothetical protein
MLIVVSTNRLASLWRKGGDVHERLDVGRCPPPPGDHRTAVRVADRYYGTILRIDEPLRVWRRIYWTMVSVSEASISPALRILLLDVASGTTNCLGGVRSTHSPSAADRHQSLMDVRPQKAHARVTATLQEKDRSEGRAQPRR